MAYINKRTYDIVQLLDGSNDQKDWFFVDDLLAETVQVLNARGYHTLASSVGIPFCTTSNIMLRNVRTSDGSVPDISDVAKAFRERVPDVNILRIERTGFRDYKITKRIYEPQSTRIEFKNDVRFKKLPKGTEYSDRVLYHEYKAGLVGFELLEAQLDYCRQLFEWSCKLPLNLFVEIIDM